MILDPGSGILDHPEFFLIETNRTALKSLEILVVKTNSIVPLAFGLVAVVGVFHVLLVLLA
jgi:hypothetical protein